MKEGGKKNKMRQFLKGKMRFWTPFCHSRQPIFGFQKSFRRRLSAPGPLDVANNPNIVQTPCHRREKKPRESPPDGNIRPGRDLWPKKSFSATAEPSRDVRSQTWPTVISCRPGHVVDMFVSGGTIILPDRKTYQSRAGALLLRA
jgi:hypothetical protein